MSRSTINSRPNIEPFVMPEQTPTEAASVIKFIDLTNTNFRIRKVRQSLKSSSSIFSYQNITRSNQEMPNFLPSDDTYRSVPRTGGSVSFALKELDVTADNEFYVEHGLKIQISLDDSVPGNVAKGWDVIVPILRYYNVARVKITDVQRMREDDAQEPTEQGKQITIYACLHPPESNWKNILYSITKILLANEVKPGYRPDLTTSNAVPNNCYISYRYDMDPGTRLYRPAVQGNGAFPTGVNDPLAVSVQNIPTPGMEPRQHISTRLTPKI